MSITSDAKSASSVHDPRTEKPPFGSRFLTEDADVWSQNAWDHVPPPSDQEEVIASSLAKQKSAPVPLDQHGLYNDRPQKHWDNFYKANTANFFKNRKWLSIEFPQLVEAISPQAGPKIIAEVGCGAGNAVFPLYSANQNEDAVFRAYDFSSHAVKLVQNDPLYINAPISKLSATVWDLTSDDIPSDAEPQSIDVVILVFVLSALHPDEWSKAIRNLHRMLKPGGLVVFRDYGRYDLTQLRFKTGRLLDDNFYVRGDKTRVYFFELDELAILFSGFTLPSPPIVKESIEVEEEEEQGTSTPVLHCDKNESKLVQDSAVTSGPEDNPALSEARNTIHPNLNLPFNVPDCPFHPLFSIEQLGVDRRLIVNRSRKLKMYRVWMQGVFRKMSCGT